MGYRSIAGGANALGANNKKNKPNGYNRHVTCLSLKVQIQTKNPVILEIFLQMTPPHTNIIRLFEPSVSLWNSHYTALYRSSHAPAPHYPYRLLKPQGWEKHLP